MNKIIQAEKNLRSLENMWGDDPRNVGLQNPYVGMADAIAALIEERKWRDAINDPPTHSQPVFCAYLPTKEIFLGYYTCGKWWCLINMSPTEITHWQEAPSLEGLQ